MTLPARTSITEAHIDDGLGQRAPTAKAPPAGGANSDSSRMSFGLGALFLGLGIGVVVSRRRVPESLAS
jgi:hypothetical protein